MSYINPVDMEHYPQQRISEIEGLAKDRIKDSRHGVKLPPVRAQVQAGVGGWRKPVAHAIGALLSLVIRP
jgi:hypothetical protein